MNFLHSIIPFLEIGIIAAMLNFLLSFLWDTRSMDVLLGCFALLLIFAATAWLDLPILHEILFLVGQVAAIALIIIFQPELRVALSKLSLKGKRIREVSTFDKFLDQLATSVYRLAEKHVGALIVLQNEDALSEYVQKAVPINADFSPELLESLFSTTTPLHDGAVIIKDGKILAASVILPLAEDTSQLTSSIGTRHRAGLGISQLSDALIIIISEESGKVSVAREGIMTRGIKVDRFKGVIRSLFTTPKEEEKATTFSLKSLLYRK